LEACIGVYRDSGLSIGDMQLDDVVLKILKHMFIANCSKKSEQAAFSSHSVVCGARLASLPSMSLLLREQKSGFDSTSRLRLHCDIAIFLTARSLPSHLSLIPCYAYLPNASQRITKDRDQVNTIFSASSKPCRIPHDRSVLDVPQT
jgi:hypothetical protein